MRWAAICNPIRLRVLLKLKVFSWNWLRLSVPISGTLWSVEMTSLLSEATKHVSNLLHQTNFRIPKIPPICNSNQRSLIDIEILLIDYWCTDKYIIWLCFLYLLFSVFTLFQYTLFIYLFYFCFIKLSGSNRLKFCRSVLMFAELWPVGGDW